MLSRVSEMIQMGKDATWLGPDRKGCYMAWSKVVVVVKCWCPWTLTGGLQSGEETRVCPQLFQGRGWGTAAGALERLHCQQADGRWSGVSFGRAAETIL